MNILFYNSLQFALQTDQPTFMAKASMLHFSPFCHQTDFTYTRTAITCIMPSAIFVIRENNQMCAKKKLREMSLGETDTITCSG